MMEKIYKLILATGISTLFLIAIASAWLDNTYNDRKSFNNLTSNIVNLSYFSNMGGDFNDFNPDNSADTGTINYWIQQVYAANQSIIHLGTNATGFIYYNKSGSNSRSNIQSVYPGIKAYFPLDGNCFDYVNGSNCSMTKILNVSTGKIFGSILPNSPTEKMNVSLGYVMGLLNSWSINFWVNRTISENAEAGNIFMESGAGSGSGNFIITPCDSGAACGANSGTGKFRYGFINATATFSINNTNNFTQNAWVMQTLTYNGSYLQLFTNGTNDSAEILTGFTGSNANISLFNQAGGFFVNGMALDDLRFYNHVLNNTEINDLYNNASVSKNYFLGSQSSFPIDNCTYSGSGNYVPSCGCIFNSSIQLLKNSFTFSGSGIIDLKGYNLSNWSSPSVITNNCIVQNGQGIRNAQ